MPAEPLTPEELDGLAEKHEKATPGPWVRLRGSFLVVQRANMPQGHDGAHVAECEDGDDVLAEKPTRQQWKANAEAIAAIHNALPSLLSMARRVGELEQERSRLVMDLADSETHHERALETIRLARRELDRERGEWLDERDKLRAEVERLNGQVETETSYRLLADLARERECREDIVSVLERGLRHTSPALRAASAELLWIAKAKPSASAIRDAADKEPDARVKEYLLHAAQLLSGGTT